MESKSRIPAGALLTLAAVLGLLGAAGPAKATVKPAVHVVMRTPDRQVAPGRAIPVEIEIISKEDVGRAEFRLKPGAAWRFDSGDREWQGELTVGSRVSLHAVLTPGRAKVDRVIAEVRLPDRGATVHGWLDLTPDVPASGQGTLLPPGTAIAESHPPIPGAITDRSGFPLDPPSFDDEASTEATPTAQTQQTEALSSFTKCKIAVAGRFVYKPYGWGNPVGVRHASVRVWNESGAYDELIGTGVTDANGLFMIKCASVESLPDIRVEVRAYSGTATVTPVTFGDPYKFSTPVFWNRCGFLNVGQWAAPAGQDGAWHILGVTDEAWEFMSAYTGPSGPGHVWTVWPVYSDVSYHIYPVTFLDDGDEWESGTIVHEYGHFIQALYLEIVNFDYCNATCDDDPPDHCGHCMWSPEGTPVSYLEGWPDYLARTVNVAYDQIGKIEPVETPPDWPADSDFENIEGYWAAIFWDIQDIQNDDHANGSHGPEGPQDSLALDNFSYQWNVMRNFHPRGPLTWPTTLDEFYRGWREFYPALEYKLWVTMLENHVWADQDSRSDPLEPEMPWLETWAHAVVHPADGSTIWRALLWQFYTPDADWFKFTVRGPSVTYRIETVGIWPFAETADTVLELYGDDHTTLLASNDNCAGAALPTSCIDFTQHTSDPKTYYVKVRNAALEWSAMGPYGLRISVICPPDTYEPNNSCWPTGQEQAVGAPATLRAICPVGDTDWVQFYAMKGMTYVVQTFPGEGEEVCADTVLALYWAGCKGGALATNNDFGGYPCSRVQWTAPLNGTVSVEVKGGASSDRIGPYRLLIRCVGDSYEPDDSLPPTNTILPDAAPQQHNLCGPGDSDFVRFFALCGVTYVIRTLPVNGCVDTMLRLYRLDGSEIASNDNVGASGCSLIQWTADATGDVAVLVHGKLPTIIGLYGLQVTVVQDAYEPDNPCSVAKPIATGPLAQKHLLWPTFDRDWVTFNATFGRKYRIETLPWGGCACTNTRIILYAADCATILAENNDAAPGNVCSLLEWLSDRTGTVYVRVNSGGGLARGPYGLKVQDLGQVCQPTAAFTWLPTEPTCVDEIQFTDQSFDPVDNPACAIVQWQWDFGDGTSSTSQNPTHVFPSSGDYGVCLTVTNALGLQASTCQTVIVGNVCPVIPGLLWQPSPPCAGLATLFGSEAYDVCGVNLTYLWDFGDGSTSAEPNPMHTFREAGTYNVCLTVTDDEGCSTQVCQQVSVLAVCEEPPGY